MSLPYETASWQDFFSYHISSRGMMKYPYGCLNFSPSAASIPTACLPLVTDKAFAR